MTKPTSIDTFITSKKRLGDCYYSLTFAPYPKASVCRPGHFIHLHLPHSEIMFRRAMSVAGVSVKKQQLEIIFKTVGRGTNYMAGLRKGDMINILGPLGRPFTLPHKSERIIIVAGGVGVPPLIFLAKSLVARGHKPKLIDFFYGGRSAEDIFRRMTIRKLGVHFHIVTEDGSLGRKGIVTEPLAELFAKLNNTKTRLYGCGPEGMLKAVNNISLEHQIQGQLSLEAPMPCGIGVCLGCVVPLTKGGHARVCVDGPVFDIGEVAL